MAATEILDTQATPETLAMPEHRLCKGCQVVRPIAMFATRKNGKPFKSCDTCRAKNARLYGTHKEWIARKLKQDPDYCKRSVRNTREREKERDPDGFRALQRAYQKTYIEKKMKEDAAGFRANQAAVRREWRNANIELDRARNRDRNKTNVKRRISMVKDGGKRRGYEWALDTDTAASMITGPCFYCGELPTDVLNGIDRMDNSKGYTPENTVGCCGVCNNMKLCLDAHTFLDRCVHITGLENRADAWPDCRPSPFYSYRYVARKKDREFELTETMYANMTKQPCIYCHRDITETNTSGIDRIDNGLGYIETNIQPCCGECNRMRAELTVEAFLEKVSCIAARAELLRIPEMPPCRYVVTRRTQTAPTATTSATTSPEMKKKTRTRRTDPAITKPTTR